MSVSLQTSDVWSTVMEVLQSCSLSVEHLAGLKTGSERCQSPPEEGIPFYRPIKWDKSYYSFTGFRDPEQELQQAKRERGPTLRLVPVICGSLLLRRQSRDQLGGLQALVETRGHRPL